MTNAPDLVAELDPSTTRSCPACGHPLDAHDRIGLRWCGATPTTNAKRDCVCPDTARVATDLTYHGGLTPNR